MRFAPFNWLAVLVTTLLSTAAPGQDATGIEPTPLTEVIVTAQKREQSASSVGMSITAATGDTLRERGIEDITQLPQVVPGFSVQERVPFIRNRSRSAASVSST